jgi:dipeptidyl aminopeptidase/acylaminoacyl peptidase
VTHLTPHDEAAEYVTPCFRGDELVWATNEGRDTLAVGGYASHWDLTCFADRAGRSLLIVANEDGYSRLTIGDVEVPLPGRGVVESPVFSPDGSKLAFAFSSPTQPKDVYLYDLDTGETMRLTTVAEPPPGLVEPTLHRFESFDGESVPVFLFTPPGEGPFPVFVMVHGGPEAQWVPEWHVNYVPLAQYLVSRGYAVAVPNVRGSSGYGKRYEHLDDIRLRLDSVRDLASLHEWLGRRPEIDASRAVVYGRSYGGYMVLAALAFQPELWAAGIESVGISSFVTFLENTSPYRRAVREREYGSLEHDRDFLVEASPITHVDAIRAPLFIQHGANDPRVPLGESEEIARVLQEKGIRCELVVYPDEGHSIAKLSNRIDSFTRAVAFLDEVLG